jgi:hypothetical protein
MKKLIYCLPLLVLTSCVPLQRALDPASETREVFIDPLLDVAPEVGVMITSGQLQGAAGLLGITLLGALGEWFRRRFKNSKPGEIIGSKLA